MVDHRMRFRKSCFCRQNVKWNASRSYRASRLLRKPDRTRDLLEGLAREPPSGQAPQERRSDGLAGDEPPGAVELGLESSDRVGCELGRDQALFQVAADAHVAVAAPREHLRTAVGEAYIVEHADAAEGGDRVVTGHSGVACAGQTLLEIALRAAGGRQRTRRRSERLRTAQLAGQLACDRAIQSTPCSEPGPHDDIRRQDTPPLAVELDGNAVTFPRMQPRDGGDHASASADASASAATSALPFDAADSSPVVGSRRAEATWSEPSSTWIFWRICCVTSGCSRRKAVAFWRPWPSRSSPKLKYEPDFVTTFRSIPVSSTVPSHEMPEP